MAGEKERNFRVVLSENAAKEFEDIIEYIAFANHQPINAISIGDEFIELIDKIGDNPFPYKINPYKSVLNENYKYVNFYNWLVFFRIVEHCIEIQGVMHGSRRPNLFEKYE
ncbi:MAG: type II toxin-antitoxin system RelE/ParE family toxin [Chitinophagales bacterium]|jgi:plasmid stabilization system protein ParE|nr:type II toxin-antitoxin system RelE/ParE family toxin [Sphingobacteriales bacterium]